LVQHQIALGHQLYRDSEEVDDFDLDPDKADACQQQHLAVMLPAAPGGPRQQDATKPKDSRDERDGMAGCMYYALYGTCVKGMTCKYASSHNREGAKKTREWIARQSAKQDRLATGSVKKVFSRLGAEIRTHLTIPRMTRPLATVTTSLIMGSCYTV
jgi:hypothetical protein